jgi:Na+/H+ antiporter NhaD/arsenite permease-like protein
LTLITVVFVLVYLGMLLGRLPALRMDRTGIALLGALTLVAAGSVSVLDAQDSIDVPTIALLFGMMVVSAQLRLGGFYVQVTSSLARLPISPVMLIGAIIGMVGLLSAVFTNDVVCLAVAPVLIDMARRRQLDPIPFLLALACASNVGSAATLIGNPQNILVGQALQLGFLEYLKVAWIPTVVGLLVIWGVLALDHRRRGSWGTGRDSHNEPDSGHSSTSESGGPRFDRWQAGKGLGVSAIVLVAFLFTSWPRELVALGAAGALLTSRKVGSRDMLGLVDWQLLVLFIGLFVVNDAFERTGFPEQGVQTLRAMGISLNDLPTLLITTVVLSNMVSNVPAIMLLLPGVTHPMAGPTLALASTFAGNFLIVGSIANILVVETAAREGIPIGWREHARIGVPVTILTLVVAGIALWLYA